MVRHMICRSALIETSLVRSEVIIGGLLSINLLNTHKFLPHSSETVHQLGIQSKQITILDY